METKGPGQLKIIPPNYMQISAFGPILVGLENVQEVVLALLFAHLSFCNITWDLIQLNSRLTKKTKKKPKNHEI